MKKLLRIDVSMVAKAVGDYYGQGHAADYLPHGVSITFCGVDFGKDVLLFDIEAMHIEDDVEILKEESTEEEDDEEDV